MIKSKVFDSEEKVNEYFSDDADIVSIETIADTIYDMIAGPPARKRTVEKLKVWYRT